MPRLKAEFNETGSLKSAKIEKILSHSGVKGMKWGVRRDSSGPHRTVKSAQRDAAREFVKTAVKERSYSKGVKASNERLHSNIKNLSPRTLSELQRGRQMNAAVARGEARRSGAKGKAVREAGRQASRDFTNRVIQEKRSRNAARREAVQNTVKGAVNKVPAVKARNAIKNMTDDQLRTHNARLALERQYRDLSASGKSKGQKLTEDILTSAVKAVVIQTVSTAASAALKSRL